TKQLRTLHGRSSQSPAPSSSHLPPQPRPPSSRYLRFARARRVVAMSDQVQELLDTPPQFLRDGLQFVNKCQKPDAKEFSKICQAVGTGFVIMGVVGYVVKLIHIPINQILVGGA
ncbi:putative protein transport protein Sec61 subunit gamma, partial [Tolypocladium ophioglossoides CBS 100239]